MAAEAKGVACDADRLATLLKAHHPLIRIRTSEEEEARQVVAEAALQLDADFWAWDSVTGLRRALASGEAPLEKTEGALTLFMQLEKLESAAVFAVLDSGPFLSDARTLRALRNALPAVERTRSHVVLIDHDDALPEVVRRHATAFELSLPEGEEIERIVRSTVRTLHKWVGVSVDVSRGELATIVKNLAGLTRREIRRVVTDIVRDDDSLTSDDLAAVLVHKRRLLSEGGGVLEAVESPASLDGVGGLTNLKRWLEDRAQSFDDKAAEFGLAPPRGVLLLGVQGAGKSLCAKAIATAWSRPLLRLDAGALYDKYIGETEKRLRDALKQAEAMSPVVLWIDEIEKAFAAVGGAGSNDGGVSKRVFGTLLTWMQEHTRPVFLVATANDIDSLPPELMRKGRFDEIFFVDLPGAEARVAIAAIHLRKRGRDPREFDLDAIAAASEGYSGAEIEQGIVSALHSAFARSGSVTTEDVVGALRASPPLSVTRAEQIAELRAWARTRCVPAG